MLLRLNALLSGLKASRSFELAAVVQLVEPLIVIQVVAGSSPVGRPIFFLF